MKSRGRYGQFIRWLVAIVDFVLLNLSYLATLLISHSDTQGTFCSRESWLLCNVAFLIVTYIFSNIHNKRVVYADQVLLQVIKSVGVHAMLFFTLLAFLSINIEWTTMGIFYAFFLVLLSIWWILSRKILKWYRTRGFNYRRIIVIGGGTVGVRLMNELQSDQGYGYRIVGFFDDNTRSRTTREYKGKLNDVEDFVKNNYVDEMYCTVPDNDEDNIVSRMINIAENNAIDFYYVPQFSRTITRRFELDPIGNVPVLAIRPYPMSNVVNRTLKRSLDILLSSIALILSPIVLIPVAIAIKLSSPGPVFFTQMRTGYRGKEFKCYKFRTMRVNSNQDTEQATLNDPRKTRVGNFLRKTSIDEMPQIYNVWRGEMSLVGPRPHMVKHTEDYSALIDKYMVRHTIKPGITGWAQVNGFRGETDQLWKMEKRVEFDVWYAENWNLMLDFKIMFLTIANIFRGDKNAY